MATLGLVEYGDASPEVRAIYDDIMTTRRTDWINNFWKALAHDPSTLRRTWESIKQIMAPGALDPLTKELLYVAVSATNQCPYCIASHTVSARKAGMTDAMFAELMAVNHKQIDDDFFAALKQEFSAAQIIELGMLIGVFIGYGRLLAVLDLETPALTAG